MHPEYAAGSSVDFAQEKSVHDAPPERSTQTAHPGATRVARSHRPLPRRARFPRRSGQGTFLAVADGRSYTAAAKAAGRRSGDAVSDLVSRFNREGMAAIEPRHGGGPRITYTAKERERILKEARRAADREADGSATWSLSTLRGALRRADDGLPEVSAHGGRHLARDDAWCETGKVKRKRKSGEVVEITDPDAEAKKFDRTSL